MVKWGTEEIPRPPLKARRQVETLGITPLLKQNQTKLKGFWKLIKEPPYQKMEKPHIEIGDQLIVPRPKSDQTDGADVLMKLT